MRFKNGLTGRVLLQESEMHGVLDVRLFEQAFIDCGVVAWPGNIDLALDAKYARLAGDRDREMRGSSRSEAERGAPRWPPDPPYSGIA